MTRIFAAIGDFLARWWQRFRDILALLLLARFALLGAVAYLAFVLFLPQGREAALLFSDSPVRYSLVTILFAVNIWMWARLMVSYRYLPMERREIDLEAMAEDIQRFENSEFDDKPSKALKKKLSSLERVNRAVRDPSRVESLRTWMTRLPRLLGAVVFLCSAVSLGWAAWRFGTPDRPALRIPLLAVGAAGMALATPGFYYLMKHRRDVVNFLTYLLLQPGWARKGAEHDARKRLANSLRPEFLELKDGQEKPGSVREFLTCLIMTDSRNDMQRKWRWYAWKDLRRNTQCWLVTFSAILSSAFIWACFDPMGFGPALGPAGVLVACLAFWIMAGTWVQFWLDHRRFPIITFAFVSALLLSLCCDNHEVRRSTADASVGDRQPAAKVLGAWPPATPGLDRTSDGGRPLTPVIVATAGGGIRAAYWTAIVLSELHQEPEFYPNLVAISAVSGGGLGGAAYLEALAAEKKGCAPARSGEDSVTSTIVRNFLARDFLSPTVAAFLGRDLVYRLLPIPGIPDRAHALERSWEQAWAEVCPEDRDGFSQGFTDFSKQAPAGTPALLINGTMVQSGRRVITSPWTVGPDPFLEAHDFYTYVGNRDIPLSTAVHNGARFTYVSPAGTLRAQQDGRGATNITGQIIDGGYFENYGAETAGELLQELCEPLDCGSSSGESAHPIVIQISSDPELADIAGQPDGAKGPNPLSWLAHHSETYAPLAGFQNTRDARGHNATLRLRKLAEERFGGTFVHLRLCQLEGWQEPPLGWALSVAARQTIDAHLSQGCEKPVRHDNAREIARVVHALQTGTRCESWLHAVHHRPGPSIYYACSR